MLSYELYPTSDPMADDPDVVPVFSQEQMDYMERNFTRIRISDPVPDPAVEIPVPGEGLAL